MSGGLHGTAAMHNCELYDIAKDVWTKFANLKRARCSHSAISPDKKAATTYVFAGWVAQRRKTDSIEQYVGETRLWREIRLEGGPALGKRDDLFALSYQGGIFIFGDDDDISECFYFSTQTSTLARRKIKRPQWGSSEARVRLHLRRGKAVYVDDEYEPRFIELK